jgi:glucan biosynthesis protein C
MQSNVINNEYLTHRIYGLDIVRVILLLLGVVLHTLMFQAEVVSFHNLGHALKLTNVVDAQLHFPVLLLTIIHTFRMPAFFMLAGFFASFLFAKYGVLGFLSNRFKRIVVPLLALLTWTNLPNVVPYIANFFLNHNIHHFSIAAMQLHSISFIWFLIYLMFMELLFVILSPLIEGIYNIFRNKTFWFFAGLFLLSLGALVLQLDWYFITAFDSGYQATIAHFLFFFCFFLAGGILARGETLATIQSHKILIVTLISAIVSGAAYLYLLQATPHFSQVLLLVNGLHCLYAWFMSFAILIAAMLFGSKKNRVVRYLSDASYFIYLAQVPTLLLLYGVFAQLPLSWPQSFVCLLCSVSIVDLILYQILVRKKKWLSYIDGGKLTSK